MHAVVVTRAHGAMVRSWVRAGAVVVWATTWERAVLRNAPLCDIPELPVLEISRVIPDHRPHLTADWKLAGLRRRSPGTRSCGWTTSAPRAAPPMRTAIRRRRFWSSPRTSGGADRRAVGGDVEFVIARARDLIFIARGCPSAARRDAPRAAACPCGR